MGEPEFVEQTDPETVFTALSDSNRVEILQALWESDETATFSELREAVGTRDSGKFNYHLDKLVGEFVTRTDAGYELTQAGKQINGAIEAGAYTVTATIEPIELPTPCPVCGGSRTLSYADETVSVDCDSCGTVAEFGVPPSVFADCDREAIPEIAGRYLRTTFRKVTSGFCPFCDGPVEPTVRPISEVLDSHLEDTEDDLPVQTDDMPHVEYDCRRCGATPTGGLGLVCLDHPAVVSFYYDRGVDIRTESIWSVVGCPPDRQSIRTTDPLVAAVTYTADEDSITVVVDETLDTVAIERACHRIGHRVLSFVRPGLCPRS